MGEETRLEEISFAEGFLDDQYLLVEMPSEDVLKDVMSGALQMEFVSNEKDPLVLCINKPGGCKTYDVKEFDDSNCLFVCNGPVIISRNSSTFELRAKPPPFMQLRELLHSNPITEAEILGETLSNVVSYAELSEQILCSKEEFDNMLKRLAVVSINSALKTAPPELYETIALRIIRGAGADWKRINIQQLLSTMELPMIESPIMQDLVKAVLVSLSSEINDTEALLNEKRVHQVIAKYVMKRQRHPIMDKAEFEHVMQGELPVQAEYSMSLLHGMIVRDAGKVKYVEDESLPIDIDARLEALFEIHKAWDDEELEPFFEFYVSDAPGFSFNEQIGRRARLVGGRWMKK